MLWHIARTTLLLPMVIPLERWLRHLCAVLFTSQLHEDTKHLQLSKKFRSREVCINELTILFHPTAVLAAKCQCFYFYDNSETQQSELILKWKGCLGFSLFLYYFWGKGTIFHHQKRFKWWALLTNFMKLIVRTWVRMLWSPLITITDVS